MNNSSRAHLSTEGTHSDAERLEHGPLVDALALFDTADRAAVEAVVHAAQPLAQTIELATAAIEAGGRLIYIGAGTSGRLGVLDAAECPPTFGIEPGVVVGLIAGGETALVNAVENAEDDALAAERDLAQIDVGPSDVVVGITAGGTTRYVHAALRAASASGAKTVFMACVSEAEVADPADVSIRLETGPEVVAGSTRLKAGTATKLALNRISTITMARLGHVARGRMVDVATRANKKLWLRAVETLIAECDIEHARADALLGECDGQLKVAWVAAQCALSPVDARARLDTANGRLDRALQQ